ncbi:hypothetical protein RRG08_011640 [Elysia crispata]|uniref:Uncharacterized protein n=1 Tax=Elysia crispata TaxID=231223 RepID=A0AAE1D0Q9_9GAST|nr:hypothetical protein RRG08_011640 [Elysia crispata]
MAQYDCRNDREETQQADTPIVEMRNGIAQQAALGVIYGMYLIAVMFSNTLKLGVWRTRERPNPLGSTADNWRLLLAAENVGLRPPNQMQMLSLSPATRRTHERNNEPGSHVLFQIAEVTPSAWCEASYTDRIWGAKFARCNDQPGQACEDCRLQAPLTSDGCRTHFRITHIRDAMINQDRLVKSADSKLPSQATDVEPTSVSHISEMQ